MDLATSPCLADKVAVGDVLAGKYRVERLLGEGGMGVVVAARHLQLDRLVALKLVSPSAVIDDVLVERFVREARAAAKLRSEHVAKVLDVGKLPSGAPYMVMEYLEGADLAEVLDVRGRFDVETACDYVLQACEAVAEAHALGIVHRDLKPDNLYLTTRVGGGGLVKVLDFGISKLPATAAGALTQTQAVLGSPLYMAPEQMRSSRRADARADVWALGVVLYELLTQRWPFEADSMPELCLKVANDRPRPVEELRPDLPAALVAVIDRCLAKNPAGRFANAAELAVALEPLAPLRAHGSVAIARMTMASMIETHAADAGTGPHPAQRKRLRPLTAALALAALVVGAGVALAQRDEAPPSLPFAAVAAAFAMPSLASTSETTTAPTPTSTTIAIATTTTILNLAARPARHPVRAPASARPPDDDIPAFR